MTSKQSQPCPGCSGTGQIHFFGGVSRFQFSYEECPECCGTGILPQSDSPALDATHITATCGLPPRTCERVLAVLAQICTNTLAEGERIQLRGFGSFSCSEREKQRTVSFMPAEKLLQ